MKRGLRLFSAITVLTMTVAALTACGPEKKTPYKPTEREIEQQKFEETFYGNKTGAVFSCKKVVADVEKDSFYNGPGDMYILQDINSGKEYIVIESLSAYGGGIAICER